MDMSAGLTLDIGDSGHHGALVARGIKRLWYKTVEVSDSNHVVDGVEVLCMLLSPGVVPTVSSAVSR